MQAKSTRASALGRARPGARVLLFGLLPWLLACAGSGEDTGRMSAFVPMAGSAAGASAGVGPAGASSLTAGAAGMSVAGMSAAGVGVAGVNAAGAGAAGISSAGMSAAGVEAAGTMASAGIGMAGVGMAGAGSAGLGMAGASGDGSAGMAGAAGTAGTGASGSCPAGFESDLPLVLTGETVPGNLELGLASAPETAREPCGLPEEQECFMLLNAERVALGREPLLWDGDLVDLARSHAADRNQQNYPGSMHGSSTNPEHLYEQRGEFLGMKSGKFRNVVENALTGGRSAQTAVSTWMGSSGHRAVIIGEGQWSSFTHAGCGRDGSEWNIEFGR